MSFNYDPSSSPEFSREDEPFHPEGRQQETEEVACWLTSLEEGAGRVLHFADRFLPIFEEMGVWEIAELAKFSSRDRKRVFANLKARGAKVHEISLILFHLFECAAGRDVDKDTEAKDLGISVNHPQLVLTTNGIALRNCLAGISMNMEVTPVFERGELSGMKMLCDAPIPVDPTTPKLLRRLSPSINSTQRQLDFSSTDDTASSSNETRISLMYGPLTSNRNTRRLSPPALSTQHPSDFSTTNETSSSSAVRWPFVSFNYGASFSPEISREDEPDTRDDSQEEAAEVASWLESIADSSGENLHFADRFLPIFEDMEAFTLEALAEFNSTDRKRVFTNLKARGAKVHEISLILLHLFECAAGRDVDKDTKPRI